jgi:hypothetical protein
MFEALQAYGSRYAFDIEVLDVDADEALLAQFDELVPVLFGSKDRGFPRQLCQYVMDFAKLEAFFAEEVRVAIRNQTRET